MTTVQDLTLWNQASEHLENGTYEQACRELKSMHIQTSKTRFNTSLAYTGMNQAEKALQMLSETLQLDTHFAIGFFQRGCIYYNQKSYQEALQDFKDGVDKLRGRSFIDYNQLGMRFKLQANDFLHNQSMCQAMLGTVRNTVPTMESPAAGLVVLPQGLNFRPPKNKVANMHKIDYLGKAKVITALTPEDNFSGFSGPRKLEAAKEIEKSRSAPSLPNLGQMNLNDQTTTAMQIGDHGKSSLPATNERAKLSVPLRESRSKTPPARWLGGGDGKRVLPPPPNRPIPTPPKPNQINGNFTHAQQLLVHFQNKSALSNPMNQQRRQLPVPVVKVSNKDNSTSIVDVEHRSTSHPHDANGVAQRHKPLPPTPVRTEQQNKPLPPTPIELERRLKPTPHNDVSARTIESSASPTIDRPVLNVRHLGRSKEELHSSPPPLPPKNPLLPPSKTLRDNKRQDSPPTAQLNSGSLHSGTSNDKVTIDLICNETHSEEVLHQSSLTSMLQLVSRSFKLDLGTFNIWCKREDGEFEIINRQEDMIKWWKSVPMTTDKRALTLWVFSQ